MAQSDTLRTRPQHLPPMPTQGMHDCQIECNTALEKSLAENHPRSLVQMATGAGKTFTTCVLTCEE